MVKTRKNKTFRKKTMNRKSLKYISKKIMKGGGSIIELKSDGEYIRKFSKLKQIFKVRKLQNKCIWYLYTGNIIHTTLNKTVDAISNYKELEKLIKEKANLSKNDKELPTTMHLGHEVAED
jgi:hypothetical protein